MRTLVRVVSKSIPKAAIKSCLAALWLAGSLVQSHAAPEDTFQTNVDIQILPFAELIFTDGNLLYLEIPPGDSTVPFDGVDFRVIGNASVVLTAEPDEFIEVPGEDYVGAAYLNGNAVGYKIELRFPGNGVFGSPIMIAALPGFEEGPTTPPLEVDLTLTGGERQGVVHMESSPDWTIDNGLPLPGLYVGTITMLLTADY